MVSCIMAALWKRGNFPGVHVMESRTVHFHKAAKSTARRSVIEIK